MRKDTGGPKIPIMKPKLHNQGIHTTHRDKELQAHSQRLSDKASQTLGATKVKPEGGKELEGNITETGIEETTEDPSQ